MGNAAEDLNKIMANNNQDIEQKNENQAEFDDYLKNELLPSIKYDPHATPDAQKTVELQRLKNVTPQTLKMLFNVLNQEPSAMKQSSTIDPYTEGLKAYFDSRNFVGSNDYKVRMAVLSRVHEVLVNQAAEIRRLERRGGAPISAQLKELSKELSNPTKLNVGVLKNILNELKELNILTANPKALEEGEDENDLKNKILELENKIYDIRPELRDLSRLDAIKKPEGFDQEKRFKNIGENALKAIIDGREKKLDQLSEKDFAYLESKVKQESFQKYIELIKEYMKFAETTSATDFEQQLSFYKNIGANLLKAKISNRDQKFIDEFYPLFFEATDRLKFKDAEKFIANPVAVKGKIGDIQREVNLEIEDMAMKKPALKIAV